MLRHLFRTKKLDEILADSERGEHRLHRALGWFDLTMMGIGAIIGAGIFTSIGTAIAGTADRPGAGPAIVVSLIICAVACAFAALCYAEFAAMIPIAGSAYTYAYATLGETIAWIIGWDLIIEYAVGNIAVAISWAAYFKQLLAGLGLHIPDWICIDLRTGLNTPEIASAAPRLFGVPIIFNLPAVAITAVITWVLVIGIRESAWANNLMVAIKLVIMGLFVVVGFGYVRPENWQPFWTAGWAGVQAGAAIIFFSYIGFDAVTTAAEETKNPKRDLPIGLLASLALCTVVYIGIALVLTGIVPWQQLGVADPLAHALAFIQKDWAAGLLSFGAVISMAAVLLVFQLGQPRIFFSMSRDGLLPRIFSRIHPRYRTPHVTTIWTGIFVMFFSAFASIDEVVELTNIGTLFAFVLVCGGVVVLRWMDPAHPRPFRTPWSPVVPLLGVFSCVYLMLGLPAITWWRFALWLVAGLDIYLLYGLHRSRLAAGPPRWGISWRALLAVGAAAAGIGLYGRLALMRAGADPQAWALGEHLWWTGLAAAAVQVVLAAYAGRRARAAA